MTANNKQEKRKGFGIGHLTLCFLSSQPPTRIPTVSPASFTCPNIYPLFLPHVRFLFSLVQCTSSKLRRQSRRLLRRIQSLQIMRSLRGEFDTRTCCIPSTFGSRYPRTPKRDPRRASGRIGGGDSENTRSTSLRIPDVPALPRHHRPRTIHNRPDSYMNHTDTDH